MKFLSSKGWQQVWMGLKVAKQAGGSGLLNAANDYLNPLSEHCIPLSVASVVWEAFNLGVPTKPYQMVRGKWGVATRRRARFGRNTTLCKKPDKLR
jgi:hypothetical protein